MPSSMAGASAGEEPQSLASGRGSPPLDSTPAQESPCPSSPSPRPPSASPHSPSGASPEEEPPSDSPSDGCPSSPSPTGLRDEPSSPTDERDGPPSPTDGRDGPPSPTDGRDGPPSPTDGRDGPPSLQDTFDQRQQLEADRGRGSDAEEEYFEEFHLPNTHENAFVRHRSFRRKVELMPIHAPDAEKIEGLVRTGEFERHGSMRRKIVPSDDLYKLDESFESDQNTSMGVSEFQEDLKEIQKLMDGEENVGEQGASSLSPGGERGSVLNDVSQTSNSGDNSQISNADHTSRKSDVSARTPNVDHTPEKSILDHTLSIPPRGGGLHTSTPAYASTADYSIGDHSGPDSLSIEQSTLNKVRDCMDFSKCKDLYNLSGKLQDILTPIEVEELLNNSHRYVDVIDSGVLEALFTTVSEQMSLTGQPLSISFDKSGAKAKAPEKELSPEQVQLQNQIKQKLLMEELAFDSLPYVGGTDEQVVMRPKADVDSRFGTIERRRSLRLKAGRSQVELESVFVESDFKNENLKKISAPSIDLALSASLDDLEDLDSSAHDTSQDTDTTLEGPTSEACAEEEASNTSASEEGALPTDGVGNGEVPEAMQAEGEEAEGPQAPPGEGEGPWQTVFVGGSWHHIDMGSVAPYTQVVQEGGQLGDRPVVVVSACHLPPRTAPHYPHLMDHLFLYLLWRLEHLVKDDYILVYLSGGAAPARRPSFQWLRAAYRLIDRRLKKDLRALLVVHPSLWVRALVALTRPFVSSKFYRKLVFVPTLTQLALLVPLHQLPLPPPVKQADFQIMSREKERRGAWRGKPPTLPL